MTIYTHRKNIYANSLAESSTCRNVVVWKLTLSQSNHNWFLTYTSWNFAVCRFKLTKRGYIIFVYKLTSSLCLSKLCHQEHQTAQSESSAACAASALNAHHVCVCVCAIYGKGTKPFAVGQSLKHHSVSRFCIALCYNEVCKCSL